MNPRSILTFAATAIALPSIAIAQERPAIDIDPDVTPLAPQESQKTIQVMAPFTADLIAAEPMINEPICMAWGGDGALYVVELLGYMQDVDHTGAQDPVGQVVRLEDTNGDGIMDKQSVFVDKLVEPRTVMAVKGGILVAAPPNVYFCQDTSGDGVADVRHSIYDRYAGRGGNVEHKDNGLMWGVDNYLYNAKSATKYQYRQDKDGGKLTTPAKTSFRGQWGITQDNIGHIYATGNTTPWIGEQIAYEYLLHNKLSHDRSFANLERQEDDFSVVWPIVGTPDVQGGKGAIRKEDNTLQRFTSIGGQTIFRGDKLGDDMVGQYFIPEPVGRLVRRATIEDRDGFRTLVNPAKEQKTEFIASSDPNFRPVHAYTGPDGCLYIVDMYRGIIQDGNWVRPGSYLREEVLRKGLDKNIQRGRIYRISKDGEKPGKIPKFDEFSSKQLVQALSHPNGWWRDEAQKRIVIAQDKSTISDLKKLAIKGKEPLARLHAIWTLRGLDAWDKKLAELAINDRDWRVQFSAIRASELVIQKDQDFIMSLAKVKPINREVAKQLVLSLGLCNTTKGVAKPIQELSSKLIQKIAMNDPSNEVLILSTIASLPGQELVLLNSTLAKQGAAQDSTPWLKTLTRLIIKSGDTNKVQHLLEQANKSSEKNQMVIIQSIAAALPQHGNVSLIRFTEKPKALDAFAKTHGDSEAYSQAMIWFTWPGEARFDKPYAQTKMKHWEKNLFDRGQTIYGGLCSACHGAEGEGVKAGDGFLAPPLAGNKRVEGHVEPVLKVLLHGLTGPIEGETYSGLMAAMGSNDDEWIAAVSTYIRRAWGNVGGTVPGHAVKNVRNKNKDRTTPWTEAELNKK